MFQYYLCLLLHFYILPVSANIVYSLIFVAEFVTHRIQQTKVYRFLSHESYLYCLLFIVYCVIFVLFMLLKTSVSSSLFRSDTSSDTKC